jgi:RimJ/RimL family protein N-acetyltransferase/2-polyprenyl-3-methyl-5-hydroxy-6-metoxy-1,4-benzoquinol methylase
MVRIEMLQIMKTAPLKLTDGVVTIRKFRRNDKFRMAEIANNEKVAVNLRDAFPSPYTLEDAQKFISMCLRQNPYQVFAIEYGGEYVGNIGLHRQGDVYSKTAELGYFIGEPYWHKGITPRAVNLICKYGFRELDVIKIFSGVFSFNTASQRVLEKCGFEREAVLRNAVIKKGVICDEIRYAKHLSPSDNAVAGVGDAEAGAEKAGGGKDTGKDAAGNTRESAGSTAGRKQWYVALFENYGKKYDSENFTAGTFGECDFVEKELGYNKGLKILDVGCGTGRHSIELTKRGYNVTGIDLSESQLQRAREKAAAENLNITFLKHDARHLPFRGEFDLAIMLCEGGFPLMETDEMNFEILRSAATALKKPGKFIFTTLNGLFPLYHSVEKFCSNASEEGNATYSSNTFDLMTFRDHNITDFEDDDGNKKTLDCNERYYVPSEITWLLKSLGFGKVDIFGARLGAYSRDSKLTTEDFEMLVIAEK